MRVNSKGGLLERENVEGADSAPETRGVEVRPHASRSLLCWSKLAGAEKKFTVS